MSRFVLTAQLQLQAPSNVSQVVSQIQSQLNNISVNVQVQGSARANQQIQQITQSTQAATTAAGRMGNAFAVSIRRFAAFSIATRAVGLFTSTLADAVKTAIDFERELVKISQVTGRSVSSLRDLTDSVTNLSTGLGVTSSSLLEVTTVLTQAGLSSEDTKIALESLARAALAPNFDSITETAEGAIAILAQFKQGVGALEGQLSSIDAVAGAFAVEAGDLIDVIRRSGGVFKASGGSLNELLALFTSVRATTRESAESIGTGLRTIFTRIQRPETIEFLKQFGVELVDLNGKFVGPYEAIRRLSEAISGLGEGDLTFIKIAEELGGFRQIGKVLPLLQQFSTAQAALNVAQNAGNGLAKNAETAQASLAIRIIKVREEFLALVRSMTETSTFQVMANTALALASALIKIADSIKPLLPLLGAVAAFKAVKGIGSFVGGIGAGLASGRTFSSGGRVHAFATGGLVPGTGNSDTVPAMLTPGEFVIRKSSVQKMGASNLAQMNTGGLVQKFAIGGKVGAIALNPIDGSGTATATITTKDILNALATNNQLPGGTSGNQALLGKSGDFKDSAAAKRKEAPDGLTFKQRTERLVSKIAFNNSKGSQKITAVGASFPSTKNSETPIEESIKKSITSAYNSIIPETAKQLQTLVGSGVTAGAPNPSIVSSIGVEDAAGKIFEGAVSSLGAPFDGNNQKGDRDAFDFPRGIGSNLAQFAKFKELESIPTDAKKSLGKNLEDIASRKTTNYLAGQVNQNGAFQQLKARAAAAKGVDSEKNPKGPKRKKYFGGIIQKFATGGNVGTDTVPALLTPGEFVVNKASAQRIGYSSLNRMNKVGKYAKGGVVQGFAKGGTAVGAPIGATGGLFSLDIGDKIVKDLKLNATGDIFKTKLMTIPALLMGGTSKLANEIADIALGLGLLDVVVNGLAQAVVANGEANKRSVQAQAALIAELQDMNPNQLIAYKDSLEADTAALTQKTSPKTSAAIVSSAAQSTASSSQTSSSSPSAPSAPLFQRRADGSVAPVDSNSGGSFSKAEKKQLREQYKASQSTDLVPMTRQEKAASNGTLESGLNKNSAKLIKDRYDKLYAEEKALITKEYSQKASDAQKQGKDTAAILAEYKQKLATALAEAKQAITKGANAALADAQASNKQTASNVVNNVGQGGTPNQKILQTTLEKKAEKGQVTNLDLGKGVAQGLNQAQLKAIAATNAQAIAAQKAAQANLQEASASGKAAAADMQESMSTSGGTKDLGNFAMGLSLVSGTMQSLLPPIDESSSVFAKMASGGLTLITTLSGVAFAISSFGIALNASTISSAISSAASFVMGTAGAAASTATLTLAGSALTASAALGGLSGSILAGAAGFIAGLAPFVGAFVNIAGPLAAAGAAFFAIQTAGNFLVESFMNYEKRLKKAQDGGNIEESRTIATEQQSSKATVNVAAGAVAGGIIGSFFGPIGTALGAAAGGVVAKGLSDLPEYAGQVAASQAATVKAQNSLAKASENATTALSNFEKGNISATELLKSTSSASNDVATAKAESKKLNEQSQKEISREGDFGGLRGGVRNVVTLGGLLGESTGAKQARIEAEQKKSTADVSKAENQLITSSQPILNSISGEVASSGGSFDDVLSRIEVDNKGLYDALISQGTKPLADAFNNIKKEVERAQKAFNAMNLGMQNVQGAAAAAALGVNNYVASQQAGNVGLEQSLAVLEASVTSAAQGISSADFGKALSDASEVLYEFGANPEQVTKFQRNVSAVNDVQKNQSSIFGGAKDKLAENIRNSSGAQGRREAFSKSIDEQLEASGYDEATRQRFKDASANMSDDQLKEIGKGNFTAFEESINELGKKTMEQVSGPLKAAIEIQKQLNELTKQRIEAERQLVSAQLEASNVRMEAMEISAQYGGPKVTPEMRAKNIAQQANIQSRGITGVTDIKTGSAQELSARTQQLSARQAEISDIRTKAAAGDPAAQKQLQGEGGLKLQEEEKKIQDAAKSQVQATRDLIKSKQEELKIIKEKNQLEKSSIDALVSGDIEKFFDQQAAVGAQAAIATGDQRLIGQFGMSALGGAAQETKRQQEAGVQELYGQKLSGPGGLTERAYGSAISAAGVQNPLAMAKVAAGSTGAEVAVENDIRDLAATMGPAADIQVEAANNQVLAAQMQLDAARSKGEEAVSQMQARQMATGGIVYANRGIFVPRGTDTVPAMLTPGEFVINRAAVQRGNNLQILQSMNRGSEAASGATGQSSSVAMMAKGGKVRYFSGGGLNGGAQSQEGGGGGSSGGGGSGFGFNLESLGKFAEALTSFNSKLETNITNLANTKFTIKLDTTNVNVNLNGASFLQDLTETVKSKLMNHIGEEIKNYSVGDGGKLIRTGQSTLPSPRG